MFRAARADPVLLIGLIINWVGRLTVAGAAISWAWWLVDARLIAAGVLFAAMALNPWRPKRAPAHRVGSQPVVLTPAAVHEPAA